MQIGCNVGSAPACYSSSLGSNQDKYTKKLSKTTYICYGLFVSLWSDLNKISFGEVNYIYGGRRKGPWTMWTFLYMYYSRCLNPNVKVQLTWYYSRSKILHQWNLVCLQVPNKDQILFTALPVNTAIFYNLCLAYT